MGLVLALQKGEEQIAVESEGVAQLIHLGPVDHADAGLQEALFALQLAQVDMQVAEVGEDAFELVDIAPLLLLQTTLLLEA